MKRLIPVLAVTVVFSGMLFAQVNPTKKEATPVAKKVEEMKIEGVVVSVDAIANTVTLKHKTGEETLSVEKIAKIIADGKEIKLADLAKNSEVVVHYKMEGGKKIAVLITANTKKAETAAPKATATAVKKAGTKELKKEVEKKK